MDILDMFNELNCIFSDDVLITKPRFQAMVWGIILVEKCVIPSAVIELNCDDPVLFKKIVNFALYKLSHTTTRFVSKTLNRRSYCLIYRTTDNLRWFSQKMEIALTSESPNIGDRLIMFLELSRKCYEYTDKFIFLVLQNIETQRYIKKTKFVVCVCGDGHQDLEDILNKSNIIASQITAKYRFTLVKERYDNITL